MAPVADSMTWLSARVPVELHDRLRVVAEADDRSVSYEVRQALEAHVERLEQERQIQPPERRAAA